MEGEKHPVHFPEILVNCLEVGLERFGIQNCLAVDDAGGLWIRVEAKEEVGL